MFSYYTKYYVDGAEVIQGKSCTRLFADAYSFGNYTQGTSPVAYLHFDGDTLWHYVESTFYPLVCFNGLPGDSWHPWPFDSTYIDTNCTVRPIEVLATFSVTHNGQAFRGVQIGNQESDGHLRWSGAFDERTFKNPDIGYDGTLFPSYNACPEGGVVDWYWNDLLCYTDSELSIINDNISSYTGETDCEHPWNLVGIHELERSLSVSPNPATSNLTIQSKTPLSEVWVSDMAGRVVLPTLRLRSGYGNIDVSSLPSGIYLVEAITEDGKRSVQKVVVE